MDQGFLLEQFEKHKALGLSRFRQDKPDEARYHFLKAAEYLMRLARESSAPLRAIRARNAKKLIDLAKNVRERREAMREPAGHAKKTGEKKEDSPSGWKLAEKPDLRFDDIAGLEEVKEQIRLRMILPFTHPEEAERYRIQTGGGILLYGPPGTGKTMIAKAVAGELDADFFSIAPSEILNKWVGESEGNIRKLFDAARACDKAIIFIDEVEALVPRRSAGEAGSVMTRVVPQILGELDGIGKRKDRTLLFVGATNEPWNIDTAMLRPGRLDEKIFVGLPDLPARRKIIDMNLKGIPVAPDVDLDDIARRLDGCSGADTAYLCRKAREFAFRAAIREPGDRPVGPDDFKRVLERLRPSVSAADLERFDRFRDDPS